MANKHAQFHIQYQPPIEQWPNGCWSAYRISGDEIAKRIRFDADGKLVSRDSWPGYLGTREALAEIRDLIQHEIDNAA